MVPVRWWKLVYSGGVRGASGLSLFLVYGGECSAVTRAVVGGAGAGGVVFVVVLPCFDGGGVGSDDVWLGCGVL